MIQKIVKNKREGITMFLICGLALFLNIWRISIQGFANEYYTAGVTSMIQSWHNFFFVAYDPGGFISIDKPPLGLWLQAISAKIFGVNSFSVLLPEILGGVISVFLLYKILKKAVRWQTAALGALFLAITPIFVVTTRTNTPDMVMIPLLLWAVLVTINAIEKQKMRYIIGAGVIVGLAFNVKMLQAYMIVPAIFGAYLLFTNINVWKRLRNLFIAGIVMVIVSLSWATVVDLTPKSERPYVGSTTSNSAMELIFGWNGISRLTSTGNMGGNPAQGERPEMPQQGTMPVVENTADSGQPPIENATQGENRMTPPSGAGGGGVMTPGTPGVTRLFQKGLGEQVSWFLVLAVSSFCLILFQKRKKKANLEKNEQVQNMEELEFGNIKQLNRLSALSKLQQQAILWMLWLLPASIYFSFSTGLFHTYYLAMLAAPIAALAALGFGFVFFADGTRKWVVMVGLGAVVCNSFFQTLYQSYYSDWEGWLIVMIPLITITGSLGYLVSLKLKKQQMLQRVAVVTILIGIVIGPFTWSLIPMLYGEDATLAQATPKTTITTTSLNQISENTKQIAAYLVANQGEATYLVAAQSSHDVSDIIIETGKPAMALGGFSGNDNAMTLDAFKALVKEGKVKYYLGSSEVRGKEDEISAWVKANGTVVNSQEYGVAETTNETEKSGPGQRGQMKTLYQLNG